MNFIERQKKKIIKFLILILVISMCSYAPAKQVQAAKVKISSSALMLHKGTSHKLKLKNLPEGAKVKWSTSNYFTATVSKKGKVKAVNYGTTTITAKYKKKYYTCVVTVPDSSRSVTLSTSTATLSEGQNLQLTATAEKKVTFMSSNTDIATVDENTGLVTAINPGTAIITAKNATGYAGCTLTVTSADVEIVNNINTKKEAIRRYTNKNKVIYDYISWAKGKSLRLIIANLDETTVKKVVWGTEDKTILATPVAEKGSKIVANVNTLQVGNTKVTAKVTLNNGTVKEYATNVRVSDPNVNTKDINIFKSADGTTQWQQYISFTGLNAYSEITLGNYDTTLVSTTVYHSKVALNGEKAGCGTIKMTVDGKSFTITYHVFEPQIKGVSAVLKTKVKKKFKINGITGITPEFVSRNKSLVTVAQDGTVTTKKSGVTYIDIQFGKVTYSHRVEVAAKGMLKIIKRGNYILKHWKYSQKKRLRKGYYDCSALVWKSYKSYKKYQKKLSNINQPLSSGEMFDYLNKKGKIIYYGYVGMDQLKPGDLIFYGDYGNAAVYSTPGRTLNIYHVSLYAGNGIIVEKSGKTLDYNRTKDIVGVGRVVK